MGLEGGVALFRPKSINADWDKISTKAQTAKQPNGSGSSWGLGWSMVYGLWGD